MLRKMRNLITEEHGQGMTEYGLVLGVIAVAIIGSLALLRTQIIEMYDGVVALVSNRPN